LRKFQEEDKIRKIERGDKEKVPDEQKMLSRNWSEDLKKPNQIRGRQTH
jgi:hypothetical protein